jgi:hypothetical protein
MVGGASFGPGGGTVSVWCQWDGLFAHGSAMFAAHEVSYF